MFAVLSNLQSSDFKLERTSKLSALCKLAKLSSSRQKFEAIFCAFLKLPSVGARHMV